LTYLKDNLSNIVPEDIFGLLLVLKELNNFSNQDLKLRCKHLKVVSLMHV